jgi:hypothetical protein
VSRFGRLALLVLSTLLAAAGLVGVASPAGAATTGCVTVDGAPAAGGGPNRATVVVDTGSGPVWSACISFSGEISGIEALERADEIITDLDPVYDVYTGLGKAVCRLRSIGSDPPDGLGKTTSYWSFSHNGRVAPVGAGAVTVRDGDVQGWRYGTGGTPRAATAGTRASTAPPTTTTTTTRPPAPTPTTAPPVATTAPGGGLSGSPSGTTPSGDPVTTTAPDSAPSTTAATGSDGSTTTTSPAEDGSEDAEVQAAQEEVASADSSQGADGEASGGGDADGTDGESAAGASTGPSGDGSGGSSSLGSALGFGVALALVGGAGVLVRRRRSLPATA